MHCHSLLIRNYSQNCGRRLRLTENAQETVCKGSNFLLPRMKSGDTCNLSPRLRKVNPQHNLILTMITVIPMTFNARPHSPKIMICEEQKQEILLRKPADKP